MSLFLFHATCPSLSTGRAWLAALLLLLCLLVFPDNVGRQRGVFHIYHQTEKKKRIARMKEA
jgi:hypothetical protein